VKVKDTEPPEIVLASLWSNETQVARNPVDTCNPRINTLDNIQDWRTTSYEELLSRTQMRQNARQHAHNLEDTNREIIALREKLKIIKNISSLKN